MTEFGFTIADRDIIIDDIRVRGVGRCISHKEPDLPLVTTQPTPERVSISISYTYKGIQARGYTSIIHIYVYIFFFSVALSSTNFTMHCSFIKHMCMFISDGTVLL